MAKKPSAPKPGSTRSGAKDIEGRLVDAMLALSETEGWRGLSVAAIARHAGVPLADVHPAYGSRLAILAAFMRRIDKAVVASDFAFAPEDTARDRLFEVVMRRFDALRTYREALRRIQAGLIFDPLAVLASLPAFGCSMTWMLEAAEIASDGAAGCAKAAGLAGVWAKTFRVWLDDDTPDLARTMAALDRNLGRAGRCAEVLFGRRARPVAEAA
jgi:AcrR family transcriptional regulator